MLVEEQIQVRRERAPDAIKKVVSRPRKGAYGDYEVQSASGKKYRVAMRGPGVFENYCSCPDFAVNTLGTCKHIEALLLQLRNRHRSAFAKQRYERQRASLALQYGAALRVKLQLPDEPSAQLQELAGKYFEWGIHLLGPHATCCGRTSNSLPRAAGTAPDDLYGVLKQAVEPAPVNAGD